MGYFKNTTQYGAVGGGGGGGIMAVFVTLMFLNSLAHKSENVYSLSDILIRDMTSGRTLRAHTAVTKFCILQAQAIAGFSSCGEAGCYPEILRI